MDEKTNGVYFIWYVTLAMVKGIREERRLGNEL